jgi:hypothetical protein
VISHSRSFFVFYKNSSKPYKAEGMGYTMKKPNENSNTNKRLHYATEQLNKHNIEFSIKNEVSGHLHCRRKSDDTLVQFWVGTGKIMGHEERGIHNLIAILTA